MDPAGARPRTDHERRGRVPGCGHRRLGPRRAGRRVAADQAAVDAMRSALNELAIDGLIVIGEESATSSPMLYIGEKVGRGGGRRSKSTSRSIPWKGRR